MDPNLARMILSALFGALLCFAWTKFDKSAAWTAVAIVVTAIPGIVILVALIARALPWPQRHPAAPTRGGRPFQRSRTRQSPG